MQLRPGDWPHNRAHPYPQGTSTKPKTESTHLGVRHLPDAFFVFCQRLSSCPLFSTFRQAEAAHFAIAYQCSAPKFWRRLGKIFRAGRLVPPYLHSRHRSREHALTGKPETRGNLCNTQFQRNRTVSGACATALEGWYFHP